MPISEFSLPVRVYIEDTDAGGIVFYVNYLKFMERARTERLRALGFNRPAIIADGSLLVVSSVSIDYRAPAALDEELQVTADVVKLGRSSMIFSQRVMRGEQCLAEADIRLACVTRDALRPTALPKPVYNTLKETFTL